MIYRLRSYHGGLGDELQFSTLPELLTKQGHEVFLLKNSNEVLPLRNSEIKKLVWDSNPFIKGELEGEWNLGDLPNLYENKTEDFIKNWELAFGLEPQNSLPKIYHKRDYSHFPFGLIDLSAISLKYDSMSVMDSVYDIISNSPIKYKQIVNAHQNNNINLVGVEKIELKSLIEIYELMCNCKSVITLSSGLQTVAAAARRVNPYMKQYCIHPKDDTEWIMKSKLFIYPEVEYIVEN